MINQAPTTFDRSLPYILAEGFMKKVLIVLIGLFFPLTFTSFAASNELVGQVTEQKTNSPIAGAKILLWSGRRAIGYPARTDSQGKFSIGNIPAGNYDVEVFHPSYIKKRVKNAEVKNNHATKLLRWQLALEPIQIAFIEIDREKQSLANSRILGKVLWKRTKEPLMGVKIRLLLSDGTSAKMGTLTGSTGNFVLLNVPPGIYQIDIKYGPTVDGQRMRNARVEAGRTYTIGTVFLNESSSEGDTLFILHHHDN